MAQLRVAGQFLAAPSQLSAFSSCCSFPQRESSQGRGGAHEGCPHTKALCAQLCVW